MKLLLIGSVYLPKENRKKGQAIGRFFTTTCATPSQARVFARVTAAPPDTEGTAGFRLALLKPLGEPDNPTRWVLRGLGRLIRRVRPDVILVESEPWALLRWQAWLLRMLFAPRAWFGEFSWENIPRPGLKGRVLAGFYRAAARTADFVIAGNRDAGELYCRHGLAPERLLVSPQLGIDPACFRPAASPADRHAARARLALPEADAEDAPLVGFCGRLIESKGVRDLIAAVETLNADRGDQPAVRLVLLGGGPMEEELRGEADRRPWLHLRPPLAHDVMPGFFQALDVFVLPSRTVRGGGQNWKEQFGHVLIEAMACGVATVGSDSGAIPEVIGEAGRTFPEGDVPALAAILRGLLSDPAGRAALGTAGRERVTARYTHASLAKTWADFIRDRCPEVPAAGGGDGSRIILGDACVTAREDRPRRFLDCFCALDDAWRPAYVFTARTDEELQHRLRWLRHQRLRVWFHYCLGPWNVLRRLGAIRRARGLYLEGPHYFWLLLLLNRLGLLPAEGKSFACIFFRHERFARKLRLFNRAPPAFQPFFVCTEQVRTLEARGATPGRVRKVRFRVDAEWYRPAAAPTRDFILCAGNIHRDERLLLALLESPGLPRRLVRAGRLRGLRETYATARRRWPGTVELVVNLDHRAYRDLVQNAALILLPIEPCDEPAGLTAALEALACGTPLLANDSLEIGDLLRVAGSPPPLPDLRVETWRAAIAAALAPGGRDEAALARARRHVQSERAIRPGNQDWHEFTAEANLR